MKYENIRINSLNSIYINISYYINNIYLSIYHINMTLNNFIRWLENNNYTLSGCYMSGKANKLYKKYIYTNGLLTINILTL